MSAKRDQEQTKAYDCMHLHNIWLVPGKMLGDPLPIDYLKFPHPQAWLVSQYNNHGCCLFHICLCAFVCGFCSVSNLDLLLVCLVTVCSLPTQYNSCFFSRLSALFFILPGPDPHLFWFLYSEYGFCQLKVVRSFSLVDCFGYC